MRRPHGGTPKLVSDPYEEWTSTDAVTYAQFGRWLSDRLRQLEAQYAGWKTAGYAHWRSLFADRIPSREAETEAAE
jgi:hypothetical protein